jgi:hypothetical protein
MSYRLQHDRIDQQAKTKKIIYKKKFSRFLTVYKTDK